jgi:hypothetical protein
MEKSLPVKLTAPQVVEKFPALYATQRFITVFRTDQHWTLPLASVMQSTFSHYIFEI